MEQQYQVYMHEVNRKGTIDIAAGYFSGGCLTGDNMYQFARTSNINRAHTFAKDDAVWFIEAAQSAGYPCHAIPPIFITKVY